MRYGRMVTGLMTFVGALALAVDARAQDEGEGAEAEPKTEEPAAEKEKEKEKPAKEDVKADKKKDKDKPEETESGMDPNLDPKEKEHEPYFFLGLRFRDIIVPEFMMRIFVDGGRTVNVMTFGPEFIYRKDELEINVGISYADYSAKPMMMRGKDENIQALEIVESDLKALYVTIDILFEVWEESQGRVAFLIGGGVGLGGVFDQLRRAQVFPKDFNNAPDDDPDAYERCAGQNDPRGADTANGRNWCDTENDHYGDYTEPSWANGGSKPFIYPWIALPQLTLRYKPIHQFMSHLDVGFAISTGFYFGLGADYGF